MALSYEFSIGSVRARELRLLSKSDIEQMIALGDVQALVRFLKDKGFGEGETIDEIIESNTEQMWTYLRSVTPDFSIFEPFLCQNDIHNFKTILKGIMSERKYQGLLASPSVVSLDDMTKAVENRRFDLLPEWLQKSADQAYSLLAETKDARMSDAAVDRAMLEKLLYEGKKSKSRFLMLYFETMVFYANIKIALRAARTGTKDYYLDMALCEVRDFDKEVVKRAALQSSDMLCKYLDKLKAYDCYKAMEAYYQSPSDLERFVDNMLMGIARKYCRYASEGSEPLMGYYLACGQERKLIHIIASGLGTNSTVDVIRERLRETYG